MRIVIVCAVLAVPLMNASTKKLRNEIIANSSHRMAIFSLSVVISFSFLPPRIVKIENSLCQTANPSRIIILDTLQEVIN